MKNFFKLSELAESTLIGRDIGERTRHKIKDLVKDSGQVTIDMENNSSLSPSFLDEAIVTLVVEYGKEKFHKHIQLININSGIKVLMNSMLQAKLQRETKPNNS